MPIIVETEVFSGWLSDLRDRQARMRIMLRIDRLQDGNPGDVASVGAGIREMRIHYGPGYRVYYTRRGETLILLLCGGDKGSQSKDVATAKKLAREWKG